MAIKRTSPTPENKLLKKEIVSPQVDNGQAVEAQPEIEVAVEEKLEEALPEQKIEAAPITAAPVQSAPGAAPSTVPAAKSEDVVKIESILAEGLENLYKELPDNRKQEFKLKGEETAREVGSLLQSAKVKIHKIVKLIVSWLKMIPGVNKFFLEQESKIKADRLLEFKKEKEEKGGRIVS